jgi:hypothetical protein
MFSFVVGHESVRNCSDFVRVDKIAGRMSSLADGSIVG